VNWPARSWRPSPGTGWSASGKSHGLQNHHDALQMLLTDPRLPAALDDIIVEFGNALPGHGGPGS